MGETYTVTYPIAQEIIAAAFVPECIICEKKTITCIVMPYGTENAGRYVCPACVSKYLDPVITAAIHERCMRGKDGQARLIP